MNNQRSNDDTDSADKKYIACEQANHVAADRKCKPTYGVIWKSLLDNGISISDAAAFVASMMKTRFVHETFVTKDDEDNSELTDTHHVSMIYDVIQEHEKEVFISYFTSAFSSEQN